MGLQDLFEDIRRHVLVTLPHRVEDDADLAAKHVRDPGHDWRELPCAADDTHTGPARRGERTEEDGGASSPAWYPMADT